MKDYYKILGIRRDSSVRDVKRNFRLKAKELHPDVRRFSTETSDEKMRILLKAYQILSNPKKRKEYDRLLKFYYPEPRIKFNYREFLRAQKDDLKCQSKLIFYDLLNSNEDAALRLFEKLRSSMNIDLSEHLSWGDYMDCSFLIAEQFEKKGEYIKAYNLFKELYLRELERPYFKHYTEELKDRLKVLSCYSLPQVLNPYENISCLEELIAFEFSSKHSAHFFKKLAEIYFELDNNEIAIECLRKALELDKNLEGIKNLQKKMDLAEKKV